MTRLAINNNLYSACDAINNNLYSVCDFEINKKNKSYSLDTIRYIKQKYLDHEIYFIIGTDCLFELETWHEIKKIFSLCKLLVVNRENNKQKIIKRMCYFKKKYNAKIYLLNTRLINISSSQIRSRVRLNKNINNLVPDKIKKYIARNNLYKFKTYKQKINLMKKYLKENLSHERYIHSLSTAREAVRLARFYKQNIYKAYMSGLMHDCAKEISQKLILCDKYKIKLDKIFILQPDLTHALLAAKIIKHEFFINNQEIINAIKYHTTGRANMSMLEKIIYIADKIEPNRNFKDINNFRDLAYQNINRAIKLMLEFNIKKNNSRMTHVLSLQAFEFYKSNS